MKQAVTKEEYERRLRAQAAASGSLANACQDLRVAQAQYAKAAKAYEEAVAALRDVEVRDG